MRASVAALFALAVAAPAYADPPPATSGVGSFGTGPGAVDSGSTTSAAPADGQSTFDATATIAQDRYAIRPGDVVSVNVYGEPSLSEAQARVLSDGSIGLPLVGAVKISGLTPRDASLVIDRALMKFLRHPAATVAVLAVAPVQVLVLGAVRAPNKYYLAPSSHLIDAIAAAGGLAPIDGDLPDARLQTGSATVETVSLQKLFHDGDLTLNKPIANGMTVYVPSPNTFQVQVLGAVDHSGDVTVREGDRLSMALARAGVSSNSNSDLNHVTFRRSTNGVADTQVINMYKVLASHDISDDVVLQKNDFIEVPRAKTGANSNNAFMSIFYGLTNLIRI